MNLLKRKDRRKRRDELAKAAVRILHSRENRAIARRDPQRLAYMIADEILNAENPPPRWLAAAAPVLPALALAAGHHHPTHPNRQCAETFTLRMDHRAAHRIYSGERHVTHHDLRVLGYIERCQRRLQNWPRARAFNRRLDREHKVTLEQGRLDRSLPYGWAIPAAIVMCESGGRNLPPNSASASGYYQVIVSTWQAYGGGRFAPEAYEATKSEQDVIVTRIWDGGRGAGQWVCKT